jgi:pantothenate kinase type III
MVYLVFDLGNSRAKFALFSGGRLGPVAALPVGRFTADPAAALGAVGGFDAACGASTSPGAFGALRGLLERGGIGLVRARERCPLAVEYGEGLGDDRVLAAHAAVHRLGAPVAAVGCGTAVTVDLVLSREAGPVFAGGAILAGEGIVLAGLGGLEALPRIKLLDEPTDPVYGSTTEDCLRLGARVQVEAAVARLLGGFADHLGVPLDRLPILFHGGNAARYAPAYTGAQVVPHAVLEGCALVAQGL